jgi:hypothetical protein
MKHALAILSATCLTLASCSGTSDKALSTELDGGPEDASTSFLDATLDAADLEPMDADTAAEDAGESRNDAGLVEAGAELTDAGERALDASDGSASDAGPGDGAPPDASVEVGVVVQEGFEDALPSFIDPGAGVLTPSQGFSDLGTDGNTFGPTFLRSPSPNVVRVTLSSLPVHSSISLAFLFAAIDSLDGEGTFPSGDYFRITLDGSVLFRETFANAIESQVQTYIAPEGVVLARRQDLGFSGPGGYHTDSAYDMGKDPRFQDIPHTSPTAIFTFELEGTGTQSLEDESWAIDSLRVTVGNTPRVEDAVANVETTGV